MSFLIFIFQYLEELAEKLSANLEEIKLECRGNLLRVTLSPRSCKQPDSLTCTVSCIIYVLLNYPFRALITFLASLYIGNEGTLHVITQIENGTQGAFSPHYFIGIELLHRNRSGTFSVGKQGGPTGGRS